ncbi:MAG TPA: type II toxin-antitoxin system RelE/ParE family toxin [Longimicrobium sp.]|nr:type II toxin-antitoxin system RelE/ParE family toxin [Longimicrobium sp.]
MSGYVVSDLAYEEIRGEVDRLDHETGGPDAGDRLAEGFRKAFERIAAHPRQGKDRSRIDPGLRSIPWGRYTIFYYAHPSLVEIARVLHQKQSVALAFGLEEDAEGV